MKAIIFDMDGVIIDSEYTYIEAIKRVLKECGHQAEEIYLYSFTGMTHDDTWNTIKNDFKLNEGIDVYINKMFDYRNQIIEAEGLIANKNIYGFLKKAYEKDILMSIASSSPKEEILRTVKELDIGTYFEYLVSGEEVVNSKPSPDIFLKTADLMGLSHSDCMVIEDSENGVKAAKAAGMYCVGYRDPKYPLQDLSAADLVVTDFNDIDIRNI